MIIKIRINIEKYYRINKNNCEKGWQQNEIPIDIIHSTQTKREQT